MQAAAGNQPLRICFHIIRYELVYSAREPDHFRRHVVDKHRPVHTAAVEILEERLRRPAELHNLLEVRPLLLHELQRLGLEHLYRLDMNVAVGDQSNSWSLSWTRWRGAIDTSPSLPRRGN